MLILKRVDCLSLGRNHAERQEEKKKKNSNTQAEETPAQGSTQEKETLSIVFSGCDPLEMEAAHCNEIQSFNVD